MKAIRIRDLVDPRVKFAREYLAGLDSCLKALPLEQVAELIIYLEEAYCRGKHVFIIGNGGSAALASHMACDLGKTVLSTESQAKVRRFRVMSLTDNVSWITALGNDLGYEHVFSEQLRNLANPGDLVIAITGSGNSPNIIEAVKTAKEMGVKVVGILGFDGGRVKDLVDACIIVLSNHYGYIEDVHTMLDHLITAYFKQHVCTI